VAQLPPAVGATSAAAAGGRAALLAGASDVPVSVIVALKRMPDRARIKPTLLPLSTPLHVPGEAEVCLFVKDPQRAVKDYFAAAGDSGGVTRVMGLDKLRKRYRTYEGKRELLAAYDLFLADDRIELLLPKLLGDAFFRAKKMPLPVRLGRNPVKEARRALRSTRLTLSGGSCVAVVAGGTGMAAAALAANVADVLVGVAAKAPGGWGNVLSVHVKTPDSVALPIYASVVAPADLVKADRKKGGKAAVAPPLAPAVAAV